VPDDSHLHGDDGSESPRAEGRRVLWRRRRVQSVPQLGTWNLRAGELVSSTQSYETPDQTALIAELTERVVLLEEALRTDRDLSIAMAPTDLSDRPGPTCIVWNREGRVVFEHFGEPALFVKPSVSASRLGAAITAAQHDAYDGNVSVDIVQIYGPPRRDLVVVGEALFDRPSEAAGTELPRQAGTVVRVIDISPQRRIEEMRRDFVTNISHELRTPVGAIGVLAEMIVGEQNPETTQRLVSRLEIESSRLARMIDDLLELAIAEASDPAIDNDCDVIEAVGSALDRIAPGAEGKQITVDVVEETNGMRPRVRGTTAQLASALHNLLDNAVKYSDAGSTVVVKVNSIADPDVVVLDVIDRGVGIPAPDRERIFERFYRVDPARTRGTAGSGGTGLGLSIVRHLVTNIGGKVSVHSIEGYGSTFTIQLPVLSRSPQQGTA
jgi:two-component system, OmpR family, sensor histidine kinase SenX3